MPFDSGSISFRRFAVIGQAPKAVDQELLDQLSQHAHQSSELGTSDDLEYGWCAGRHILDDQFTFDNNVYADALHFALRIDTNKVPSELVKAYRLIEEQAISKDNPSGFISKNQKRTAKDSANSRIEDDLRSGKFRRSKLVPILWDLPGNLLYCNISPKGEEKLHEIFERSFSLTLQSLSAGALALRVLETQAKRRDYEDVRPTRFAHSPGFESRPAEYPWVAKGPEAKDFLGNEFVLWLWHQADTHGGVVRAGQFEPSIMFDKTLDLDCTFGETGRVMLKSTAVATMPEAHEALRTGKVPRKAGMIIESAGAKYVLTLAGESFAVRSLTIPKVEDAENARVLFEERITLLRDFNQVFDGLFQTFLSTRTGSGWEGQASSVRKWINKTSRAATMVTVGVG